MVGLVFFFQQMWTRKEESRTRAVFRGHLCALCYSSYIFLNTLHLLPRLHHPTICCPCPTCMRSVVNLDRNLFLSFYFWQSKQPQVRLASPLKCHIMPKKKKKNNPRNSFRTTLLTWIAKYLLMEVTGRAVCWDCGQQGVMYKYYHFNCPT